MAEILDDVEPVLRKRNIDFTKFDIKTFTFRWTIPQFDTLSMKTDECLDVEIPTNDESSTRWYLQVYPNGTDDDNKDYVCIFLRSYIDSVNAQCVIELLDSSSNVFFCQSSEYARFAEDSEEGEAASLKRKTLQKFLENSIDRNLTIIVTIIEFSEIEIEEESYDPPIKKPKDSHSNCVLKSMLTDQIYTDFTINVQGRHFKVHKAVLCACSPVFATMLSKKENEAIVGGVEPEVFEKILEFMYTGSVATIDADAMDLVTLAHRYDLKGLLEQCEAVLCFKISVEMAGKLLVLSSVYSLKYLKNIVIKYIKAHLEVVTKTAYFKTYVENDPKLLMMLLMH